jgi:hypothetical protein
VRAPPLRQTRRPADRHRSRRTREDSRPTRGTARQHDAAARCTAARQRASQRPSRHGARALMPIVHAAAESVSSEGRRGRGVGVCELPKMASDAVGGLGTAPLRSLLRSAAPRGKAAPQSGGGAMVRLRPSETCRRASALLATQPHPG